MNVTDGNKKVPGTVIYQVGHYGFLINCFLHKMKYHKDNDAVFLLDKVIADPLTVDNFLKVADNFKYIGRFVFYNDRDIFNNIQDLNGAEKYTVRYFDDLFAENRVDIGSAEEIYSVFDTFNAFGAYLSIKKIKFCMVECFHCQCQNHDRYKLNNSVATGYDEMIFKHLALSADSKYCVKLYSYDETIFPGKPTITNNSPSSLLKELPQEEIIRLTRCYGIEIETGKEYWVYTLSSAWWRGKVGLTYPDGYVYGNQKMLDYFAEGKDIIIKPHPNSDFEVSFWEKEFSGAKVIPGFFPSFLIEHLPSITIKGNISSSVTGSLPDEREYINIPYMFFEAYTLINKLYTACMTAKYLGVSEDKFYHYGIHNKLIWSMSKEIFGKEYESAWSSLNFPNGSVTIIDNIFWNPGDYHNVLHSNMRSISNDSVIVFLNSQNDFIFLNRYMEFLPYIYEIRIEKTALSDTVKENLNHETIYVFCKNKETISKLSGFYLERILKYQQFKLTVNGICLDRIMTDISIKTDFLLAKNGLTSNTPDTGIVRVCDAGLSETT